MAPIPELWQSGATLDGSGAAAPGMASLERDCEHAPSPARIHHQVTLMQLRGTELCGQTLSTLTSGATRAATTAASSGGGRFWHGSAERATASQSSLAPLMERSTRPSGRAAKLPASRASAVARNSRS